LEALWVRPGLARGVLRYLAATQATRVVPEDAAEPGKIVHEIRQGEMAVLREVPFGRYYGSVDATPLFVMLAGAYFERTGDRRFVQALWPHVDAALRWIDDYGDRDGDGLVEYGPPAGAGLRHQGWRDTDDAVFHADGSDARGNIALCEVQGYVYAARLAGASLAATLGDIDRANRLRHEAEALREAFERRFWCEELSTYALALDGEKRPCRVRSSAAGQCLFTGIAASHRAEQVAAGLFAPDAFSGWGIRTVAESSARYNPMGYHTGAVWPHDNALIALGLSRYGRGASAAELLATLFAASLHFDLNRVPELFCGFARRVGEAPIGYPLACAPQAWSAASALCLLQAALGVSVNGVEKRVSFVNPHLPPFLGQLRVHNLEVGDFSVDLTLTRHPEGVHVQVLRGRDHVKVEVIP
jgi:glycogen debranching enzyme